METYGRRGNDRAVAPRAVLVLLILMLATTSLLAWSGGQAAAPSTASHASARPLLQYSLPPDKLAQAHALYRLDGALYFATTLWGLLVLWMMLRFRFGARLRSWAERTSRRRLVQAAIVMSVFVLVVELTNLPFHIYAHHISLQYGFSVQHWGWWFEDWAKSVLLGVLFASFLGWILYAVIRRSPRRWWFYFWLALIPIVIFGMFIEPIWIEPMFNRFEPLSDHHPELVAQIERVVHRAGMDIPPQRMFEMKASDKWTTLNAYVTGFGVSKRVVVWDTTMRQMTTPETLVVFGHEMGHYALNHIPREVTIDLCLLLLLLYLAYRLANGLLARYGARWEIRDLSDWASLPLLALLMSLLAFLASPVFNGVSRHYEHQADQYGLEVVHGLIPDEPLTAAHAFQKLGELSLDYPDVNKFWEIWAWTHPTIRDRMIFVQTYDPWADGKQGEFVKDGR
jgi:STE24 endopeptidase